MQKHSSGIEVEWLERVRQGVAQLEQHYNGRWRLDKICFGPTAEEAALAAREAELQIRLPEDYRNFLLHIGNGGFGPGHGLRYFALKTPTVKSNRFSLDGLMEMHSENAPIELKYSATINPKPQDFATPFPFVDTMPEDAPEAETGYLEITDFGCGSWAILVISGSEYGNVWDIYSDGTMPYEKCFHVNDNLLWETLRPQRYSFKDWYLDWLQAMLKTAGLVE